MRSVRGILIVAATTAALLGAAGSAAAQKLVTVQTPSKYVDASTQTFSAPRTAAQPPSPRQTPGQCPAAGRIHAKEALPHAAASPRRR